MRHRGGATVAVTGATGEVGAAVLRSLQRDPRVATVRAMARRPFSPAAGGLDKVRFESGDVRSRADVQRLLEGADAVVHLAFAIPGRRQAGLTNVGGSRIVFEETVRCGAARLCTASSIGGYGPQATTEALHESDPFRGTGGSPYARQKAEMEELMAAVLTGSEVDAYALRLAIVAGPAARLMLRQIPQLRLAEALSPTLRRRLPGWLWPPLPDSGVPLQVVHEDDAAAAFLAAALGEGAPGAYNIAAAGTVTVSDLAAELGWRALRLPRPLIAALAALARRLPPIPALAWLEVTREPVLVRTDRARRELGWRPRFSAAQTLAALVAGGPEPAP